MNIFNKCLFLFLFFSGVYSSASPLAENMKIKLVNCVVTYTDGQLFIVGDRVVEPIDLKKWADPATDASDFLFRTERGSQQGPELEFYGQLSHAYSEDSFSLFKNSAGLFDEFNTLVLVQKFELRANFKGHDTLENIASVTIESNRNSKSQNPQPTGPSLLMRLECGYE